MTTLDLMLGAPSARQLNWKHIIWHKVENHVRRLQMRIAKAIKLGRQNKAKALQWILTHSFYAKCLAVKRVTQSSGKNTPGVDKVMRWAKRRHPNKNASWVRNKYFTKIGLRNWCFCSNGKNSDATKRLVLIIASDINIIRHIKVKADANPYDPEFKEYFRKRYLARVYQRNSMKVNSRTTKSGL